MAHLGPDLRQDPVGESINRNIYMGRGGFKFSPRPTRRFLALTTGIGGGRAPTGTYLAPDLGLSLGLEGHAVVPFAHLEVIGSFPISKNPMTAALCRTNKHRVESTFDPQNNVIGRATLGMKIPLPERRSGNTFISANLYLAGMVSVTPTVTGGGVAGVEVIFGKRSRHGR